MPITSKIDPSKQLTTFTVIGKISSDEIIQKIESFYKKQVRNNVLWDFRYSDLDALIFSNELESIASKFFKANCKFQKIGKTAVVASPMEQAHPAPRSHPMGKPESIVQPLEPGLPTCGSVPVAPNHLSHPYTE